MDTVLGRVAIRRAWYHCDQCHHGWRPANTQLGVAGHTMSPGLRKMIARAAAAVPFAAAARLISELAGLVLTGRRELPGRRRGRQCPPGQPGGRAGGRGGGQLGGSFPESADLLLAG